jgi:hypothetical protein
LDQILRALTVLLSLICKVVRGFELAQVCGLIYGWDFKFTANGRDMPIVVAFVAPYRTLYLHFILFFLKSLVLFLYKNLLFSGTPFVSSNWHGESDPWIVIPSSTSTL